MGRLSSLLARPSWLFLASGVAQHSVDDCPAIKDNSGGIVVGSIGGDAELRSRVLHHHRCIRDRFRDPSRKPVFRRSTFGQDIHEAVGSPHDGRHRVAMAKAEVCEGIHVTITLACSKLPSS